MLLRLVWLAVPGTGVLNNVCEAWILNLKLLLCCSDGAVPLLLPPQLRSWEMPLTSRKADILPPEQAAGSKMLG